MPPMPEKLGIKSPPTMEVITRHINNLNDTLLENWNLPKSVTATFTDLFEFLQNKKLEASISGANLIPIEERRLVRPSRIYFKIPENLSPFIFQVPPVFMKYEKLFRVTNQ
jgi:uncharacterized protein YfkK (UPF0435 family)